MPYVLHHYFDPDFDHTHLRPKQDKSGNVDHYDLGYVQNVVVTQVLAELFEIKEIDRDDHDPRFVLETNAFPKGPGTTINPDNPNQLIAETNGYVFYSPDGRITVKKILNIRSDVNFRTGNILFVGDVVVHGAVRSGFAVEARNIMVKGVIEGASVKSPGSIIAEGGVKGAKLASLEAEKSIRAAFCENAEIKAEDNIHIAGPCMHSMLYAGRQVLIQDRLQGGALSCKSNVYVAGQLGGGQGAGATVQLGYDPLLMLQRDQYETMLEEMAQRESELEARMAHHPSLHDELAPALGRLQRRQNAIQRQLAGTVNRIKETAAPQESSLSVAGPVKPGVDIYIGETFMQISEQIENVTFSLKDETIVTTSPARKGP